MPLIPPQERKQRRENDEIPNRRGFKGEPFQRSIIEKSAEPDPVVQNEFGLSPTAPPLVNFQGISNLQGVYPPDPNMDVGPNHIIQTVNSSMAIYGKSGNLLWGPADIITLWNGFPGPWSSTNDGDPVVLYDPMADRWLISQFALPSYPNGPFYELIAVSQTGDPLGSYHRYAFSFTNMPDYPKFGVWPDGYYMSINTFTSGSLSFAGPAAVAFERAAMLTGATAQGVLFQLNSTFDHMLPADLDGATTPPVSTPNYFTMARDGALSGGSDRLEIYELRPDWVTIANSTFTGPTTLLTAAFDMNMCNFNRNCIPQPSTAVGLDALSDLMMHRVQYRNFGTHQTMVLSHTVDATGTDRAGIRWYELRNTGAGWSVYQQATYSPDATHRWIGSIAMNGQGDIALGYSVSSSSIFPSIRYTGRKATDPLNTMTVAEQALFAGTGSQTGTANRWGDYTMMAVDPADDETFWYTNEYLPSTSAVGWTTRIASFSLNTASIPRLGIEGYSFSGGNENGKLEFNECVDLMVTLRNSGNATASSISTTLSSSTLGVTIVQSGSSYASINSGGTGVNSIPFQLQTSSSFVCGTNVVCNLAVSYSGGAPENNVFVIPTCQCTGTSVTGSIQSGDPTQTGRLTRDGVPSNCSTPKTCPGVLTTTGPRLYDAFTWTNNYTSTVCISTTVTSGCGSSIFVVAYLNSFNPASLCTNYLADLGGSFGGTRTFSFDVGAGSSFVIVVHAVNSGGTCSSYTLDISGLACGTDGGGPCTPVPITLSSFTGTPLGSNRVLLEWRTISEINNFGFEVQKRNSSSAEFQTIPNSFIPGHGTTNVPQYYSYTDSTASPGSWFYRLKQIDFDATIHYTDAIRVDVLTDVSRQQLTPVAFSLEQNYPNPFNPSTTITYGLPMRSRVLLEIFNPIGQRVATIVDEEMEAGYHQASLQLAGLASGVYMYRLTAGGFVSTRKLVLLR
jgi:hypothetical protein